MTPRISIAMAAFNGEKYIREQLESFGTQIVPPNEVVISDDDSSDKTVDIIEAFKARAKFEVHLLRNEGRIGYIANFGNAISKCTGDIIFISDQDDVWFPEKIQKVCKILEEHREVHCIVNDMELTDGSLKPWGVTRFTLARRMGTAGEMIAGCGTTITRQWRNFALPFPLEIPYDAWVGQLAQRLGVLHFSEERLQYYRRHEANTSYIYWRVNPSYFTKWLKGQDFGKCLKGEVPHNFEAARWNLAVILERLTEGHSKGQLDFISENAVALAIQTLERELTLVERRAEIVARPRRARIYPVISLLLSGEYELASGALSALKDVVGPRRAVGVRTPSALS